MQTPDDAWRDIDLLFKPQPTQPPEGWSWIQNVSKTDVEQGRHFNAGDNSMLIQILDPQEAVSLYANTDFPIPIKQFKETYQFRFLDVDNKSKLAADFGIQDDQAKQIVELLQHALAEKMNIVVHCAAGICRSGAVVEVGVMMGFVDTNMPRIPNSMVKYKLMEVLGWTYG